MTGDKSASLEGRICASAGWLHAPGTLPSCELRCGSEFAPLGVTGLGVNENGGTYGGDRDPASHLEGTRMFPPLGEGTNRQNAKTPEEGAGDWG